jgi:hypothetical protein
MIGMKRCNDRHIPLWIKRMRYELFNQEIVSQEYLILVLETKENDQMDETLPYTKDFFNSFNFLLRPILVEESRKKIKSPIL